MTCGDRPLSSDNVTALAMMWESADDTLNSNSTITTHTLPVGSVTTTIQAPRADLENADAYNDNEIERAIDEIRGAIEKSSRITSKH